MANSNEYMRQYMLARYYRRREAAIEQLGGKCIDCGSVEDLEFDHAVAANKTADIGKIMTSGSEVKLQEELAKCVLRCNSCHKAKSIAAGDIRTVPHGGGKAGKKNCTCALCKDRRREYMRNWKASRA